MCHIIKKNKSKTPETSWEGEFELPDGSYSVSDIHDCFEYIVKKQERSTDKPHI